MKYDDLISKLCERAPRCPDTEAKLMAEAANAIADLIFALKASNDVIVNNKPKWIPVAERLPEQNTRVIGFMAWKGITAIEYQHGKWYSIDHLQPLPDEAVTHWMPLPQPPKEETDG